MTEHITNIERMDYFLNSLCPKNTKNIDIKGENDAGYIQMRQHMTLIYGEASEIFEESLQNFVDKIIQNLFFIMDE